MTIELSDTDEQAVRDLYARFLEGWNARDAEAMASTVIEQGTLIGYDGSEHTGRETITSEMAAIFANHEVARYVWIVRGVMGLGADSAILRASVGMVPPGKDDINPAVNTTQTVVATKRSGEWLIVQMQNTPVQYHGRPELLDRLTEELRGAIPKK